MAAQARRRRRIVFHPALNKNTSSPPPVRVGWMKAKQFLSGVFQRSPLRLSPGVSSVTKKYSCAAVACILRVVQRRVAEKTSEPLYTSADEISSKFDEQNDKVEILFMKRTKRGGDRWSGDVAFPGGFLDLNESDLQGVTREVSEELGLNLADSTQYQWLGRLKHIDLGQSRTITPHLFLYLGSSGPVLKPEESEVAAVEWINLQVFLDKAELDTRVSHIGELYSRSQGENSPGLWLFSAIAGAVNCSSIYFPAVHLPIVGNFETMDSVNSYLLNSSSPSKSPNHWILWGMTFKFITDLLQVANNDQPYLKPKLPLWFNNSHVNMSLQFWHQVFTFTGLGGSRLPFILVSFSSLFGIYGLSIYGIYSGYLAIVS
jgi:8-oxo-dGTP pyrophosphatase MutT (NUDIX family)